MSNKLHVDIICTAIICNEIIIIIIIIIIITATTTDLQV
jgi:hypothetical protein